MSKNTVVRTSIGDLKGTFQTSSEGDDYYAFKGVPYAKPPIGQLRFRDPVPIEPWTGVRDVTKYGSIAMQIKNDEPIGSEDCLYLNVYTKRLDMETRAPVMFWIHGGGFQIDNGSDDEFGPDFLLRKDVVLVTLNYRLNIFGFLNLEDKAAPGNQGFKDQLMALQWVNTHIKNFGGNPENVTIFGVSAGAVSVHHLTISPLAKGLFHKAICQSGVALCPWSMIKHPKENAFELLELLNFKEKDPEAIVDFLRSIDSIRLMETLHKLETVRLDLSSTFIFGPGTDNKSDKPFMPEPQSIAAERGIQVPLIIGHTNIEALFLSDYLEPNGLEKIDRDPEYYNHPAIPDMLKSYNLNVNKLKEIYMNNEAISNDNIRKYLEFMSDTLFTFPIHKQLKIQIDESSAPTYYYLFSFDKNLSLNKKLLKMKVKGANHTDELTYLFKSGLCMDANFVQLQEGTGAERVMHQMVEMWTNFAKTGIPTPETSELLPIYWKPVTNDVAIRFLNIGEELRMEKTLSIEHRYT